MGDVISSREDVARLLGRVAFGATAADLDTWTGRPYAELVSSLVDIPTLGSSARVQQPDDVVRLTAELANNLQLGQRWWLGRMKTTLYPLEERMVLFWHDHWATAVADAPNARLLLQQNETLRLHSLGNFRAMCQAMTVDAAMLQWLDGDTSTANRPNENYAREFFELFTLGTIPQPYTEADIREAARVLTGWNVNAATMKGQYIPARHDKGTKVVLGTTIDNLEAEEYKALVDVALAQPEAPRFVAYKLVQNLAYRPPSVDLAADPDPLVEEVAGALTANGWDIRNAVRTLLLSDRFRYADPALEQQTVRQPSELAVHGAKAMGVGSDENALLNPVHRAGQRLFQPPNVGGWPGGRQWLSSTTAIARYDIAVTLTNLRNAKPELLRQKLPPAADVDTGGAAWAAHMGLPALRPSTLAALQSYLASRRGVAGATEAELQSGLFILLASSPDWEVM